MNVWTFAVKKALHRRQLIFMFFFGNPDAPHLSKKTYF